LLDVDIGSAALVDGAAEGGAGSAGALFCGLSAAREADGEDAGVVQEDGLFSGR